MADLHIVVLAAGKGTRMKSSVPKVLHRVAGKPMIGYVLEAAARLAPTTTTVVVGHQLDALKAALAADPGLRVVVQEPQLGTAHALLTTEPALQGANGILILLSGDVPLLSADTLKTLVERHAATGAATVVTAVVEDPGRMAASCAPATRLHALSRRRMQARLSVDPEINGGIYAFTLDGLFDAVRSVNTDNAQSEYYLPDLVAVYRQQGRRVETITVSNSDEIQGINSRFELAAVSRIVRQTKNTELMAAGVTIEDPATTYIDSGVEIGADTLIHPCVTIAGRTSIGGGCEIHSGVQVVDSLIGDRVTIRNHCVIAGASIAHDATVGPFTHLRPQVSIGEHAKVGNFVEMKNTVLGPGSKAMHLSYLGDTVVGSNANVGAGTITCNYDGVRKHKTTIKDGAFIGSDTQLIAPVTVGEGAYVGTGTTNGEDVPAGRAGGQRKTAEHRGLGRAEEEKDRKVK